MIAPALRPATSAAPVNVKVVLSVACWPVLLSVRVSGSWPPSRVPSRTAWLSSLERCQLRKVRRVGSVTAQSTPARSSVAAVAGWAMPPLRRVATKACTALTGTALVGVPAASKLFQASWRTFDLRRRDRHRDPAAAAAAQQVGQGWPRVAGGRRHEQHAGRDLDQPELDRRRRSGLPGSSPRPRSAALTAAGRRCCR